MKPETSKGAKTVDNTVDRRAFLGSLALGSLAVFARNLLGGR